MLPICRQFASLKDNISNGHSALALVNVLLGFAIVTILVTTAWFGNTGAKQTGTVSIDPMSLMVTTINLPTEHMTHLVRASAELSLDK